MHNAHVYTLQFYFHKYYSEIKLNVNIDAVPLLQVYGTSTYNTGIKTV